MQTTAAVPPVKCSRSTCYTVVVVTLPNRCFSVCFSGQGGTIALKLGFTYEEHLHEGPRSTPLPLTSSCDPPSLFAYYFQVNTDVSYVLLDYVEGIYVVGDPLFPLVLIFNPKNRM